MRNNPEKFEILHDQRGGVLVFVLVSLVVLIAFAALAIDIGYAMVARNELQNAADSAALAAARQMGVLYQDDINATITTAGLLNSIIARGVVNNVTGEPLNVSNFGDLRIGAWRPNLPPGARFVEGAQPTDAVQVTVRRTNATNPVTTFLAGIFGVNTMDISAIATAALTGPAATSVGEIKVPFGLSEHHFINKNCKNVVNFGSSPECEGWHNFFGHHSTNEIRQKMLGMIAGDTQTYIDTADGKVLSNGPDWLNTNFGVSATPATTPEIRSGDRFNFNNGVQAHFNNRYLGNNYNGNSGTVLGSGQVAGMRALFDYFRYRDGDRDNNVWTTVAPVYRDNADGTCRNTNDAIEIVGFAIVKVLDVIMDGSDKISVDIDCSLFSVIDDQRGNGTSFGSLKGAIPQLVQ